MEKYQVFTCNMLPVLQVHAKTAADALRIAKQKGIFAPAVAPLKDGEKDERRHRWDGRA